MGKLKFQKTIRNIEKNPQISLLLNVCPVANISLTNSFSSGQVKFGVTRPDGQVEVNS